MSTILIRGYDPYDDAIDDGRHLLPLVRAEVAPRSERYATRHTLSVKPFTFSPQGRA